MLDEATDTLLMMNGSAHHRLALLVAMSMPRAHSLRRNISVKTAANSSAARRQLRSIPLGRRHKSIVQLNLMSFIVARTGAYMVAPG